MPPLDWRDATIPKKSGGVRHIKIPNDQLKAVQKEILNFLYHLYYTGKISIASFAHGFVPCRNTSTSLQKHSRDSKVFLCCDAKDFFDTFPMEPVRQKLLDAGLGPYLVDKILKVCSLDGHFPQGAPTSPFLTNIGMLETDLILATYADNNGFRYSRYADDLTFSLKPDQEVEHRQPKNNGEGYRRPYWRFFIDVETILRKHLGIKLKHAKNHVIFRGSRNKPQILGIVLRQDNLGYSADKKLRYNTRAAVHQLAMKVRAQRGRPTAEDLTKWREIVGAIQYMDYVRSFGEEGANNADPCIQEKYFNYLKQRMEK